MAIRLMITMLGTQRPPYRRAIGMPMRMLPRMKPSGSKRAGEHQQQRHADGDLGQGFRDPAAALSSLCLIGAGRNTMYSSAEPIKPSISNGKARGPTGS